jgi:radical SAM superfamily enzyme YgiQ (UPF0313 family)
MTVGGYVTQAAASVLLVGFQDQGNLGIGYLAATLMAHGHHVVVADFADGPVAINRRVLETKPQLVGFSIIFQYYVRQFADLARDLRSRGVTCHLTAGGHFPTLCPDETFEILPELDSIVRFEGEETLLELAGRIAAGQEWRDVRGIAYVNAGRTVVTPSRSLASDLDALPPPYRPAPPEEVVGARAVPILASRGCPLSCSFCSIHVFYGTAAGRSVRVRRPAAVVDEMRSLHDGLGARIFLFQDDEFPLRGSPGRRWMDEFCTELTRRGLVGRVIWKISCRADDVQPAVFAELRDAGLYLVYLGLESGNGPSLQTLNKRTTVDTNLAAVTTLKEVGLIGEYGFMMFDPSTTFEGIQDNVVFLRMIVGDGSGGATFCRMLPYGGTPIRQRLMAEGRLKGGVTRPDYDFLDRRVNAYHEHLDGMVGPWIHGGGVSHTINWAWNEASVIERLIGPLPGMADYQQALARLAMRSNDQLLSLVERSARLSAGDDYTWFQPEQAVSDCRTITGALLRLRNDFIADQQVSILDAFVRSTPMYGRPDPSDRPTCSVGAG